MTHSVDPTQLDSVISVRDEVTGKRCLVPVLDRSGRLSTNCFPDLGADIAPGAGGGGSTQILRSRLYMPSGLAPTVYLAPTDASGLAQYQQEGRAAQPFGAGVISNIRAFLGSGLDGSQSADLAFRRNQGGAAATPTLSITSGTTPQTWLLATGTITLLDGDTLAVKWVTNEAGPFANQSIWLEMTFTPAA